MRRDAGKRRSLPPPYQLGGGYRVNPATNAPEFWCSSCRRFRHTALFDMKEATRVQRVCSECKEILSKLDFSKWGVGSITTGPHGGARQFSREVWHYLKPAFAPSRAGKHGKRGRPMTRMIRGKIIKRILSGKSLSKKYMPGLRQAIVDPEKRVHFETRLWLAFRPDILENKTLRLCGCELAECMLNDHLQEKSNASLKSYRLGEIIDKLRELVRSSAGFPRVQLRNMRSQVSKLSEDLDSHEKRREFNYEARYVFYACSALLEGVSIVSLHTISFYFINYFQLRYGSKNAAASYLLTLISKVIQENDGNAGNAGNAGDAVNADNTQGVPVNTFWMEYDHFSPTRFLVVTDSYKDLVELRVISNDDTPEEIGEFVNAKRHQFTDIGPGYYMRLEPEDIIESGVSVNKINTLLSSWEMETIRRSKK